MEGSSVTPPAGYKLDSPKLDLSAGFVPKQNESDTNPPVSGGSVTHPAGDITAWDEASGLPIVRRTQKENTRTQNENTSTAVTNTAPVGTKDPESGRTVTQPTDDPNTNQALATDAMPDFKAGLQSALKGIKGAELVASRDEKNPKRLAEKINEEDQPPETVSDYGAAQISVDSPEALKLVIKAVKDKLPIVKEDDNFNSGDAEFGYRNYSLQLQMPNGASQELQIVPKEVFDANASEHKNYKAAREAGIEGDKAEEAKNRTAAKAKNDAAMDKFNARNQAEPSVDGGLTKGAVVKLPDGSVGKVNYVDANLNVARVTLADGKSKTVQKSKLTLSDSHILVKEHFRARVK